MAGAGTGTNTTTETSSVSSWETTTTQALVGSVTNATMQANITETSIASQANITETSLVQEVSTTQVGVTETGSATDSKSITHVTETSSTVQEMPVTQANTTEANSTETSRLAYPQTTLYGLLNLTSSFANDKYSSSSSQNGTSTPAETESIRTAPSLDKAVNISIQATVLGYTTSTFQPFIFRAGLAALLRVDLARVLVMSVISVAPARRAVDAVQVTSVVAASDSNDASRVLAVMSSPGAAANLTQQLQALGMRAATVSSMTASLVEEQQSIVAAIDTYNGFGRERFGVIVGLGSVGGALVLFFLVALALYRLKPSPKAETHSAASGSVQLSATEAANEQRFDTVQGDIVMLGPATESHASTQNARYSC